MRFFAALCDVGRPRVVLPCRAPQKALLSEDAAIQYLLQRVGDEAQRTCISLKPEMRYKCVSSLRNPAMCVKPSFQAFYHFSKSFIEGMPRAQPLLGMHCC